MTATITRQQDEHFDITVVTTEDAIIAATVIDIDGGTVFTMDRDGDWTEGHAAVYSEDDLDALDHLVRRCHGHGTVVPRA